jgi:ABC-2 type transport system permease protein
MNAITALTGRIIRLTLRDDLPFAILATAGIFGFFNFALGNVIDTGQTNYSQYVLPVIIVQVTFLGALTTVDRAAQDQWSGFGIGIRTLPIPVVVPLIARMLYCLLRGVLALLAAIAVGYVFGFRMGGGFFYTASFVALVLLFTLALSLGADATGTVAARSSLVRTGASSQLLLIPQMLLVMLSTGMAPVDSFPDWLHTFVRYQPVSQVTESLQGFATGRVAFSNLATSLAWCLGMLVVFGVFAVRSQRRTE